MKDQKEDKKQVVLVEVHQSAEMFLPWLLKNHEKKSRREQSRHRLLHNGVYPLKEKKAELLRDVESFKGEVLLATISNKQEQDRILGKVASFRNRAEKLANSKEAKLLKPDGLAENWQKTLSDLWDMCPRAVIAETEDIVHESKRGALISNVREKLMEHIKKIQSGQEIQLKPIIDDIAEGFME